MTPQPPLPGGPHPRALPEHASERRWRVRQDATNRAMTRHDAICRFMTLALRPPDAHLRGTGLVPNESSIGQPRRRCEHMALDQPSEADGRLPGCARSDSLIADPELVRVPGLCGRPVGDVRPCPAAKLVQRHGASPQALRQACLALGRLGLETVDSDRLAQELACCRRQVDRLFSRAFGRSAQAHLRYLRVQMAARLIQRGWKVEAVAAKVGIRHVRSFRRMFVAAFGIGPRHYRTTVDSQGFGEEPPVPISAAPARKAPR
jgi:AraC-like DNA-binding protein